MDPVLKANVYNALFNSDPTHSWAIPQYTCPTGNCTWDPVATLGIRTVCSNISSQLKTTCSYNTTTLTENCTVALNSLSVYYETYTPGVEMTDFGYLMAVGTDMDSAGAPTITYILASGTNNSPEMGGDEILNVSNNTQWIATECSLEPAVLSFQASVTEGVYSEIQLAEWTNSTDDNTSDNYTYFYVAMNPPGIKALGCTRIKASELALIPGLLSIHLYLGCSMVMSKLSKASQWRTSVETLRSTPVRTPCKHCFSQTSAQQPRRQATLTTTVKNTMIH